MRYGELDLEILRVQRGVYEVVLGLTDPDSQAELAPVRGPAALDATELLALRGDPDDYGRALTRQVFADPAVRGLFVTARAALERGGALLQVRVVVEPSAGELHDLCWELLRDPEQDTPLATSERVLLSRFMRSRDWRPVRLRPRSRLRAVVAVASPTDIAAYRLARLDVDGEVGRATAALADIEATVVGQREACTLDRLVDALREGVDIVYLLAHGALSSRGEAVVFLQGEAGEAAPVTAVRLAGRLAELAAPPRLMVLASCESAGREDATGSADARPTAEAALAPALADAGVAAVIAMQGRISVGTVQLAMPRFFRELLTDGQVDRAMAVARGAVRDRHDHWMPALYHRLKGGKLWYEPQFTGATDAASQWTALCQCVHQGRVLPILGPDLDEGLFGGVRRLAAGLAREHGLPRADREHADLATVAQSLSVERGRSSAYEAVQQGLVAALERHAPGIDELPKQLDAVVERRRAEPDDPHRLLAGLPASIYLTASPETLLFKTIKAAGKHPEALLCRWRATRGNTPQEPRPRRAPTPEAPLVFHVFGVFGTPDSLVLTVDDFLDYLITVSTYKLLPAVVRGALTDNALLFLGFRLDDTAFRVLFRMIMNLEGSAGLRKYSHVGVQINPDEHSLADVERARRELERYFASDRGAGLSEPPITLFWGSPADFLGELARRLADTREAPPRAVDEDASGWF